MQVYAVVINIEDIVNAFKYYDVIEVQKSITGPAYADARSVTTVSPAGASITGTHVGPFSLNGKTLALDVDGVRTAKTFTGPDPYVITSVLRDLESLGTVVATSDSTGYLVLTTVSVGGSARLTVLTGSAAAVLGFTSGAVAYGTDQHLDLLTGVSTYNYVDMNGTGFGYYRYRLVNLSTGAVSAYSAWFPGPGVSVIPAEVLIEGYANLADLSGSGLEGAKVTIVNVHYPLIQSGFFIAGQSVSLTTDTSGHVSTNLVRGAQVDVILEGTSIIRRITVPTSGTSFDLLDPTLQVDDPFGIKQPDLPAAVRHS